MSSNTLLVYYSVTGNTRKTARLIARVIECDVEEVIPEGARIRPFEHDIEEYGTVIIGTPIWDNELPAPILRVLEARDWQGVKVFPFFSAGGVYTNPYSTILDMCKGAAVADPLYVIYDRNGRYVRIQE